MNEQHSHRLERQPRRVTITLNRRVHEALLLRSAREGRSVSNLCAFLLEDCLRQSRREPGIAAAAANLHFPDGEDGHRG